MKAKDLRIGSIISINGEPIKGGISYTVIQDVSMKERRLKNAYLDLITHEPIPITEQWLMDFGFEYAKMERWMKGAFCLHFDYNEDSIKRFYYCPDTLPDIYIEHVHQLQNLYHSLTGKELILKQDK